MIGGINNLTGVGGIAKAGGSSAKATPLQGTAATSFADTLKQQIEEVAKIQQDASQSVENLAVGKTDDVSGVMTAVEKSDLAFKTLMAIRTKCMDAYDEIKNMQV
ncbi:MAG: flagellar hook-basal body complex protein FliE [Tepidisphaeraceae bacterium]|jgi:flagellar hook-basal body complex protein FliE